jgi:REP element-mobilizing transposase RayT
MPRQARLDAPNTLHHVMIRGIEKRRIVDDRFDRKDFVSRIGELATETHTTIYAWALLINHAHILLRSGPHGLSRFMRRFLTGYALYYNRRHQRFGHLFQNRYKSIVCEEDVYFVELVRYIHLNPLRAGLVKSMSGLDRYPWCGHSDIMGHREYEWQDCDYVLGWFGKTVGKARKAYHHYISEGIDQGRRPDLVGGGLIRSMGGWSQVISLRRHGERTLTDERILGSGDFVQSIIDEADQKIKYQLPENIRQKKIEKLIKDACKKEKVNIQELKSGSRRRKVSRVRSEIAVQLVEKSGLPLAETARHLGVSTSAISKILRKMEE